VTEVHDPDLSPREVHLIVEVVTRRAKQKATDILEVATSDAPSNSRHVLDGLNRYFELAGQRPT